MVFAPSCDQREHSRCFENGAVVRSSAGVKEGLKRSGAGAAN